MNLLVCGFSSGTHCEIISGLSERSFDIAYWVGKKRIESFLENNRRRFARTLFHDYTDALAGIPAPGMNTEAFAPIGTDIIQSLVSFEPQILSLMSRIDFCGITVSEKQRRYYHYVWYWNGVLSHLKPDVVVFHDVPHIVFDTVLYYVAKMLGIKTVLMRPLTSMRDRVAFFGDFHDYREVREEYRRLEQSLMSERDIDPSVKDVYGVLKGLSTKHVPQAYAEYAGKSGKEKSVEVFPRFSRILISVLQFRFFRTSAKYIRLLFTRRELCNITKRSPFGIVLLWENIRYRRLRKGFQKEYESLHTETPDLSQRYIYFPLHSQPEPTTNPMGGIFDDQILAADLLAKSLPPGWKLYVKEHADQWTLPRVHTGRYPGYYKTLARHKNVALISVGVSGFDLIQNAKAVATIAGSPAMEAVARGKPACVFGYPMYAERI